MTVLSQFTSTMRGGVMPQLSDSYEDLIRKGVIEQDAGRFGNAISIFGHAINVTADRLEQAQAFQLQAINLRLAGRYPESRNAFQRAMSLAGGYNQHLFNRIKRDYAQLLLDVSRAEKDDTYRTKALEYLQQAHNVFDTLSDPVETAITQGFEARALRQGNKNDKRKAIEYFHAADTVLRASNNRTYELNNRIWMMKDLFIFGRLLHLPHTLRLIRQTGQTRRYLEIIPIVLTGGWFHDRLGK